MTDKPDVAELVEVKAAIRTYFSTDIAAETVARAILPILHRERLKSAALKVDGAIDRALSAQRRSEVSVETVLGYEAGFARGRREGIEEAAKVADDLWDRVAGNSERKLHHRMAYRQVAASIRALAEKQP